jgi:polar amino acid transport system substrate-binding protein
MSVGGTRFLALLLVGVTIAGTVFAAGCSRAENGPGTAGGIPSSASAAARAQAILGHAPTGIARTIVDRGTVIVAIDADYPPQSSLDQKSREPVGFDVDVAEQVGTLLGLAVRFKTASLEMIPTDLKREKYDVAIDSVAVRPQSETLLGLTDPYYYTPGQIFVAKGGARITGVADLDGKSVGVGADTVFYTWLKENSRAVVKMYTTDTGALQDLAASKVDFVMTAAQTGQQAIRAGQPLAPSGDPLYYEDLAFATKPREADWLALLDEAIRQMHEDGALTAMSKTWFGGTDLTVKK